MNEALREYLGELGQIAEHDPLTSDLVYAGGYLLNGNNVEHLKYSHFIQCFQYRFR